VILRAVFDGGVRGFDHEQCHKQPGTAPEENVDSSLIPQNYEIKKNKSHLISSFIL